MSNSESLSEILDAWTGNRDTLDELREKITRPGAIPLVPFVGAGLTVAMGFPGWRAFLLQLAGECGETDAVTKLLDASQYEEAAEAVEQALSSTVFHRRVSHVFGERRSRECALTGAVMELPTLAKGAVVTTNFDRVLERVYREAGAPFEHVVWG